MTVYYYHPTMPWRSFKAIDCEIRRQGTTSAKRPKKNYRIYIKKATEVIPLYPDYTNEDALTSYALFAMKKVRVTENSIPVDVITIKVDFSNSGGANDCSVCDMVNATYRALGEDFLTPAQRCYDGTWDKGDVHLSGLQMNHSTANHPIAVFRSNSDTLQNVWFEAKGNWKEDKGEQVALGFKDVPGYKCLTGSVAIRVRHSTKWRPASRPWKDLTQACHIFSIHIAVVITALCAIKVACGRIPPAHGYGPARKPEL